MRINNLTSEHQYNNVDNFLSSKSICAWLVRKKRCEFLDIHAFFWLTSTEMASAKKETTKVQPAKKRTLSISIPSRFTQQQILYTLLLVAVFLIGYLIATVQGLKNPTAAADTKTAAVAGANQAAGQQAAPTYTDDDIKGWAKEIGLDTKEFNTCYDSKKHQEAVDKDTADGQTAGVSGTPTFYINGIQIVGAQPFSAFQTAIDAALAGTATGTPVTVDTGHLPVMGQEDAPVTIVEFSDLECPYCQQYFKDAFPQIKKAYVDTGKVKMYYRHYPLPFHPSAKPFALAVECANDQGKFWELHDKIFNR